MKIALANKTKTNIITQIDDYKKFADKEMEVALKYCKQCKIHSKSNRNSCPLCSSALIAQDDNFYESFPPIKAKPSKNKLVFRVLFLISTIISLLCITVDIMLPAHKFFSIYVIIGLLCLWVGIIHTVNRDQNVIKNITSQVFIISFIAVIWDIITNWNGWSIEYVIPIVCINALIIIAVVARILQYPITNYILYLLINTIFGIVPVFFLIFDLVEIKYPSIICVLSCIVSLLVLLTFEGKNMLEELKRKFHL